MIYVVFMTRRGKSGFMTLTEEGYDRFVSSKWATLELLSFWLVG